MRSSEEVPKSFEKDRDFFFNWGQSDISLQIFSLLYLTLRVAWPVEYKLPKYNTHVFFVHANQNPQDNLLFFHDMISLGIWQC